MILRHSDGEWAVSEIERLRAEVERIVKDRNEFRKLYGNYVERFTETVGEINTLSEEVERLREENKGLMKLKEITFKEAEDLLDHDDFNDLIHNIAIEVKNIESSKTL